MFRIAARFNDVQQFIYLMLQVTGNSSDDKQSCHWLQDPEPFGMRRMAATDFPEQFPATTTEFAEARPGDDEIVASFRPLLANTQLELCALRSAVPLLKQFETKSCKHIWSCIPHLWTRQLLDFAGLHWQDFASNNRTLEFQIQFKHLIINNLTTSLYHWWMRLAPKMVCFLGRLAYDAQRDGWSAEAFHNGVDSFGAAVRFTKG